MLVCRIWGISTAVAGGLTAWRPRVASELLAGSHPPPPDVVRVLGVREVTQGLVLLLRPTRRVATLFVAVDVVHLATMAAAVKVLPRYRQSEIISGTAALASALVGLLARTRLGRGAAT